MKKALNYIIPIVLGFLVGFLSQQVQADSIENWYPYLNKPSLTPPNWLFPIMWGLIYITSGLSLGYVLNSFTSRKSSLSWLWGAQLVLNFVWCLTFFYMRNPLAGAITIIILDIIVIWYMLVALKYVRPAGWLYSIYILWLALATYLNLYILMNN